MTARSDAEQQARVEEEIGFTSQFLDMILQGESILTTGVSPEGFSNNSLDAAALHRRMIDSATDTYVLADHTKFDRTSLTITAPLADVTGVVTDAATPPASLAWLRDVGLDVIVAAV